MTRITQWAFRNKSAIGLLIVLIMVIGGYSYLTLPKEFVPSIDQPIVTVTVLGQGMDTQTMTNQVTEPIEQAVSTLKGKSEVISTTLAGYSSVQISFDSKTSMKDAKVETQDAISDVSLPAGARKPVVAQLNTSMIPVSDVALTYSSGITENDVKTVNRDIVPQFQGISGVATAQLYGVHTANVYIHLNQDEMKAKQIPLQAVTGLLQGRGQVMPIGQQTMDGKSADLQVVGQIDSLSALQNLDVVPGVPLSSIATVEQKANDENVTRVNGKDALVIVITKNADSNAVTVSQKVQTVIDQINKQYSSQFNATVAFSTADQVVNAVNSMTREVLLGALFATIVILLFLRSIRMTLVTIVSIPLSLALTLYLLSLSGITLNILTLGAIAVAVGRLVDDSIVVIENIYRKAQLEGMSIPTVISATKEVASAITASTLTTVAVFLPMGLFVEGSLRQMLLPFALSVTYALGSSLLAALAVVPLLSSGILKKGKLGTHKRPERYIRTLVWSLNHKWVTIPTAFAILIASIVLYVGLPQGAIDSSDTQQVQISLSYPGDTPFDTVKTNAESLESFIQSQSETKVSIAMIGSSSEDAKFGTMQQPTLATYLVTMKTGVNAQHFIDAVQAQKAKYTGADLSVGAGSFMGSGPTINMDLYSKDETQLPAAEVQVKNAVQNIAGVQKVSDSLGDSRTVYQIVVNPNKANAGAISQAVGAMLNPIPIGTIKTNNNDTPVFVSPSSTIQSSTDLGNLYVMTPSGVAKLSTIATINKTTVPSAVLRKDGNTFDRISITVDPKKLSAISKDVQAKTKALSLPTGVTLQTGGATTDQASQFGDLGKTMLVAIGLVYLIMVITFKKIRTPLAILFTLPLAAIGAVLALVITKIPVDPTALIGALMLIGIVVTNAIVLLDKVHQNEEHMIIREAIIEGAATRVRPILMTAIATIFAMLPLLFAHQESGSLVSKSLAIVVIGGLSVATLLTLVVIPAMYELLHFRKSKKQRVAQAKLVVDNASKRTVKSNPSLN